MVYKALVGKSNEKMSKDIVMYSAAQVYTGKRSSIHMRAQHLCELALLVPLGGADTVRVLLQRPRTSR